MTKYQTPTISLFKYNARRAFKLLLILSLLIAVRPAFALFNGNEAVTETIGMSQETDSIPAGVGLASAVGTTIDETLPTDRNFPELHITAGLVTELGSPTPLFVYRSNARWPLASVSKLMTAVVAIEQLGASTIVPVSAEAVATEGESGGLKAGERYTVIDLVRAMLTVSSNDAAVALAQAYDAKHQSKEAYAGAINKAALFTAAMQQKARDLGMTETYYGDPSGLSVINQSVVTDLAALIEYVRVEHPALLDITHNKANVIAVRNSSGTVVDRRTLLNINEFAGRSDFLGGKTGKTDEAGGNLLSLFSHNGKKYLIIVLGTDDRFGETTKLYEWIKSLNI